MSNQTNEEENHRVEKKSVKKQKEQQIIKRPLTAYMLFCAKIRNQEKDKKLSPWELGKKWNTLSELEKKPFVEQYELSIKEYDKAKAELEKNKSEKKEGEDNDKDEDVKGEDEEASDLDEEEASEEDEDEKKKNHKVKAKIKKQHINKNNKLPCNCGTCDDCVKRKKIKEEEEEELEDNKLAKQKAKKAVDDEDDD